MDKPIFLEVIAKYYGDRSAAQILEILSSEVLRPDGLILVRLSSLLKPRKEDEADNLLKARQYLYRFLILGEASGWFGFLRELTSAHEKRKDQRGFSPYLPILAKLRI